MISHSRKTIPDPVRPCSEVNVDPEFKTKTPINCGSPTTPMCKTAIGIADSGVVISVFAWEIIGRRISIAMTTNFVLDTRGNKILALRYCFPSATETRYCG